MIRKAFVENELSATTIIAANHKNSMEKLLQVSFAASHKSCMVLRLLLACEIQQKSRIICFFSRVTNEQFQLHQKKFSAKTKDKKI